MAQRSRRLSSVATSQSTTFKPYERGAPDAPGTGQNRVPPASSYQRPQVTGAEPVRSGSREITRVNSAGLVQAGSQTTGGQTVAVSRPAQHDANSA
jgi:hypothetical protein